MTFGLPHLLSMVRHIKIGALKGYEHANATALTLWEDVYPDALHLALTDTFSTEVFYKVGGLASSLI